MIHMRRKHNPIDRIAPINNLLLSHFLKPLMLAQFTCHYSLRVTRMKGKQTKCSSRIQEQRGRLSSVAGQDPSVQLGFCPCCLVVYLGSPLPYSKCCCHFVLTQSLPGWREGEAEDSAGRSVFLF